MDKTLINSNPTLAHLNYAIENGEISAQKVTDFEKWMRGEKFKKIPPEQQECAVALLRKAQELLESGRGNFGLTRPKEPQKQTNDRRHYGKYAAQEKTDNRNAAGPEIFDSPFHNPYTFIPFPTERPERNIPTLLTMDELKPDRLTGVLTLELKTLSPLLSSVAFERGNSNNGRQPKRVPALKIGSDVIVPASSVRGVLRSLMTIISGGASDYIDENLWLCQGRDVQLDSQNLYLAQVVKRGDGTHDGEVIFGPARLVESGYVRGKSHDGKDPLWIDNPANPQSYSRERSESCSWQVKVSGRKVNAKGVPHEGAFQPGKAKSLRLPKALWLDYQGRNRHGGKNELKEGDLVWLEPMVPNEPINSAAEVKSIQWARWGRQGRKFMDKIPEYLWPDYLKADGKVDMVSDLFGSVSQKEHSYAAFAARIRPENLVFRDGKTFFNEMPPLYSPHPGCVAFYMNNDDYDTISLDDAPRGYKVYRTTSERGADAPWQYKNQPFERAGEMCCQRELLKEGETGKLKIAFRSLTKEEFALLLLLLSCDLRIGGGKPLGLGHCAVTKINAVDETGNLFLDWVPDTRGKILPDYEALLPEKLLRKAAFYCKTQEPVEKLRYPRAVSSNGNQRGGMCWFTMFAAPKKSNNKVKSGLQSVWTDGELKELCGGKTQIRAQGLPLFDQSASGADRLFGYDVKFRCDTKNAQTLVTGLLDGSKCAPSPAGGRHPNDSQNRRSRQDERDRR